MKRWDRRRVASTGHFVFLALLMVLFGALAINLVITDQFSPTWLFPFSILFIATGIHMLYFRQELSDYFRDSYNRQHMRRIVSFQYSTKQFIFGGISSIAFRILFLFMAFGYI